MRDNINCGPLKALSIFIKYALTLSPTLKFSFGIICSLGRIASRRPISMIALPRSILLIWPETNFSSWAKKSLRICSLSASLTFCKMTCFAACAPIRPNSTESIGSLIMAPTSKSFALSSDKDTSAIGISNSSSSTTVQALND